jgi:single-stranded-DNA-specific exonuclease
VTNKQFFIGRQRGVTLNPGLKRWLIKEQNPHLSKEFSTSFNISPLVSQLLINRGLVSVGQADFFINATLKDLYSPFLMKDMDKAVQRIITAMQRKEKICVYGDYDVDGITATAVVLLFLREVKANAFFYLPNRLQEGYGLDVEALKKITREGATLLITVDCGISDWEPIQYARTKNLDIIVTDHHEPPEKLPPAHAILNPKQPGCSFPFRELAGVGVAFNLIMALRKALRERGFWQQGEEPPNLKKYLDLVALGTIADIVPLVDENRILVKSGLEVLSSGERIGIRALKAVSAVPEGTLSGDMVTYRLAPRINASGRLSTAATAVELMITNDAGEAQRLARLLHEENMKRQQLEKAITADARTMIAGQEHLKNPFVLASPSWHQGVIGICASRLVEDYYRPTVLISIDEKTRTCRGSARSIHSFDLYHGLKQCAGLLTSFGGHKYAAGLSIAEENISTFTKQFTAIFSAAMRDEDFIPLLEIDAQVPLSAISDDVIEDIEKLAPFGTANPEPLFCSNDLRSYSSMVVGNGHLKLKIKEAGCFYDAIGFNMGTCPTLQEEEIKLAFVPQFNLWQGIKSIQLKLKDIQGCSCASA